MNHQTLGEVFEYQKGKTVSESSGEFFFKSSELFESPVYLEEAADVLCILQAGTV